MTDMWEKDEPAAAEAEPQEDAVGMNKNIDVGSLLVEDCQSYEGITMKEFSKRTAENLCSLYKKLFDIKKEQDVDSIEDAKKSAAAQQGSGAAPKAGAKLDLHRGKGLRGGTPALLMV